MPQLTLQIERVEKVWEEGLPLLSAGHRELGVKRPLAPDIDTLRNSEAAGIFKALIARLDGEMVGYFTWMVDFDIESYGLLIAQQCAWYVKPDCPGVAAAMFDWVVDYLKGMGVKFVYLRASVTGRGAKLGTFFERKGAHIVGHNYELEL